jgi:O-antigen ligase
MMLLIMCGGISFYFLRGSFTDSWKLNKVSSTTQNPTIGDETKSITNISNDISNAERLNRWSCAYRMFLDHPLTGFGPGTYQFQYFSYQRESEMTRISVNTPYNNPLGKGGSAHSEYLLALSESGIFGFLGMAGIMLFSIFYGMRGYYAATLKTDKLLIASAMMAVITYASHTIFNNYLNIDKTASLFWISVSIIATIDSRYKNEDKIKKIA